MPGGIEITAVQALELVELAAEITVEILSEAAATANAANNAATANALNRGGPWSPPQFGKAATYMLSFSTTVQNTAVFLDENGNPITTTNFAPKVRNTFYIFDAVLDVQASTRLEATQHPIQTGANISDHAYLKPSLITLNVKMSDAMAAFPSATPWAGNPSKSISAYLTLLSLQQNRIFLTLSTQYSTYKNLLLTSIETTENNKTTTGFIGRLTFQQIFTASVATIGLSSRQNATDQTNQGTLNTTAPSTSTINNNTVNNPPNAPTTIPGAGQISSFGAAQGGTSAWTDYQGK